MSNTRERRLGSRARSTVPESEAPTRTRIEQVRAPSKSDGEQEPSQARVTPKAPPMEITSPGPKGAVLRLGMGQPAVPGPRSGPYPGFPGKRCGAGRLRESQSNDRGSRAAGRGVGTASCPPAPRGGAERASYQRPHGQCPPVGQLLRPGFCGAASPRPRRGPPSSATSSGCSELGGQVPALPARGWDRGRLLHAAGRCAPAALPGP